MTDPALRRRREGWLLAATFLVAVAGLIYELIAATVSSYLLGDSVRQFSFVIGIFLSAMGLGAWLSRFVGRAIGGFVAAQIALGLIGGFLAPAAFFAYAFLNGVALPLYGMLISVGVLSGMEIPLLTRVLAEIGASEFRFENVLTADYLGALIASLAFPVLIVPHLSLVAASLAFGCLNLGVAGLSLWIFRDRLGGPIRWSWAIATAISVLALVQAERLVSVIDTNLFEDDIILTETTPYQKITVTRYRDRVRLFLDHSIQFDTLDEHRYHESLVHPAFALTPRAKDVLVLGGGDGMATREILRHARVESVTLVDLDARVTELFRDNPQLAALNGHSLSDPRVRIVNRDAWRFIEGTDRVFDLVIADLPDPKNLTLSKLYSREFYGLLADHLAANGIIVTQAGSPLFAREAFWSVEGAFAEARNPLHPGDGLATLPYHSYVPSFGEWGFVIASMAPLAAHEMRFPEGLDYLTPEVWRAAQVFAADTDRVEVEANTIGSHPLVQYYEDGWEYWFR